MKLHWIIAAAFGGLSFCLAADRAPKLPADEQAIVEKLPRIPAGLNGAYSIKKHPSKSIVATYTYTIEAPLLKATEWTVFFPAAPTLPSQRIVGVRTTPVATEVRDLSPLNRPLLRVDAKVPMAATAQGVRVVMRVDAELIARRLVARIDGAADVPNLSIADRRLALRPTQVLDYPKAKFAEWMTDNKLPRGKNEGEIDYARRVYQHIVRNIDYKYEPRQIRQASFLCGESATDCGGMANLFVSALRSQGVPARTLAGRWAMSAEPEKPGSRVIYYQEHVKTEFFAQGVGWVPADLSSAVLHDKSPEKLHFFGHDRGDFLTWHIDSDITYDTVRFGTKHAALLQLPTYWAAATGSFDDLRGVQDWHVESRPSQRE